MYKLWDDIVDDLQGTCKSMYEILQWYDLEEEHMPMEFFQHVDNQLFLCESCGWWCELSEESDAEAQCCTSCVED